ncbi:acyltransferase family protein [Actinoplanes sp. NPDC051411]|uniref:acyltransferase family protein n=1 Tax=Actinoplanes sp. NPDC051411 TaxID=3155522 RepID=UPI00342DA592
MRNFVTAERTPVAGLPSQRTLPGGHPDRGTGGFRADIEGLRAVAVLLVVLGHVGVRLVPGGFVGVDVFFVISGFLITSLLVREASTGRLSIARFYARRAVRLLPAAVLVLVVTLVAARFLLPVVRLGSFAKDALSATGYVANFRFAWTGTDYLSADQSPSPFQHFWSLAVEEQFYLFWPLLILALSRWKRILAVVLTLLVLSSFALSVTETARSAPWAYFGPHTRVWELGVGALLGLWTTARKRQGGVVDSAPPRGRGWLVEHGPLLLGWTGLAAILLAAIRFDDATAYPGWRAALPVGGAALLLAADGAGVGRLLTLAPMQTIGRLSYSWYLWHWPVLVIAPAHTTTQRLLAAAGALGLAALTYRFVESPIRRLRDRPRQALTLGAGLSATAAIVACALVLLPHAIPVGAKQPDLRTALAGAADPGTALAALIEQSRGLDILPANLQPRLSRAARDRAVVWDNGCHVDVPVTAAPDGCVFGDPNSTTTVVLFGDSHAAQWFPALDLIAQQNHWRLVSLSKSSCSAADLPLWHDTLKRPYTECAAFHRSAVARITALKPALVVIGSSFNYRPAYPEPDEGKQWKTAWDRTFSELSATGSKVAAIADTPYMSQSVPECLGRPENQKHATNCRRSLHSALRGPVQRQVFLSYATSGAARIIDPITWFCTDACPTVVGNTLVYRDSNHMTTTYAKALAPLLAAALPR